VKATNRIWGTAAILALAIIGCGAGLVIMSNHDAKIKVRRNRVANIDVAIGGALNAAKEVINKKLLDVEGASLFGKAGSVDAGLVRELFDKQRRTFNFCEEEVSALNSQRRQNEAVILDLMDGVNECTILTVVCMILGLYSVFWIQRYT
jgi:hypothetical protein